MTREEKTEYDRLRYQNRKDLMREQHRADYIKNKEKYKERARNWAKQFPDKAKSSFKKSRKARVGLARQFVIFVKSYSNCQKCGFNHPAALHFHHIKPQEKNVDITKMSYGGYSIQSIKKEMKKCIILCANCHAIHHFQEHELSRSV